VGAAGILLYRAVSGNSRQPPPPPAALEVTSWNLVVIGVALLALSASPGVALVTGLVYVHGIGRCRWLPGTARLAASAAGTGAGGC